MRTSFGRKGKGRYDLLRLCIKTWVADKTVWSLSIHSSCVIAEHFCSEVFVIMMYNIKTLALVFFVQVSVWSLYSSHQSTVSVGVCVVAVSADVNQHELHQQRHLLGTSAFIFVLSLTNGLASQVANMLLLWRTSTTINCQVECCSLPAMFITF